MGTDSAPITVVLADDHAVVRSGPRLLLERTGDLEVVSEAGPRRTACARCSATSRRARPRPQHARRALVVPRVADASPGTRVVMLTMQADAEVARRALRAGATGYVRKEAADSELVEAIRRAAAVPLGADGRVASRAHIQEKLRLSTRAELVRYALDRGLLESTGDTA